MSPKTWIVLSIGILVLAACGGGSHDPANPGNNGSPGSQPPSPAATTSAVGVPILLPVSATIDAAGGSLKSFDGRLTVAVPPNALSSATNIEIQPITNTAPGGVGQAYRLLPDGQTFAVPVQLSFNYNTPRLGAAIAPSLTAAYQDSQGVWQAYTSPILDTANQVVTVGTTHFTDWAWIQRRSLQPMLQDVEVGKTAVITLVDCREKTPSGGTSPPLVAVRPICLPVAAAGWRVEGVDGGDALHGTIAPAGAIGTAIYRAPSNVPPQSVVKISVQDQDVAIGPSNLFEAFIHVTGPCGGAPVCTWESHFERLDLLGGWDISADVIWQLVSTTPGSDGTYEYAPTSGELYFNTTQKCTISPTSIDIASGLYPGTLHVDFVHQVYKEGLFTGVNQIPIAWFCGPNNFTVESPIVWLVPGTPAPTDVALKTNTSNLTFTINGMPPIFSRSAAWGIAVTFESDSVGGYESYYLDALPQSGL